jgi:hypothetical protein
MAEMIPKILDVALLQGPPPMKIGVVEFWTVPLVATSQKIPLVPLLATEKMENAFLCGNLKHTSYKICGPCKYAHLHQIMIRKFSMKLAETMVWGGRKPSEPLLGAIFCGEFFSETLAWHVWYFSQVPRGAGL